MFGVFDAFFLMVCVDLKIQFKLLNKTLQSIKIGVDVDENHEEFCWNKLKECFEHHRFLLRCVLRIALFQAEKLVFEIYSIDWYNSNALRIRKFVLFWLIKAQIPLLMTGRIL
ncbi:hypothetical protein BDFB_010713, partial [Asbolus verrucosus]